LYREYFTIDEVLKALENEKAIDVYTVNLEGKSSLADYMVFCTGRSQAHMRRMADMLVTSIKARRLEDDFDYGVEGRDCDDWMITDCNNIVIHYMREDTRRILNLEEHWENMENDQHKIYGNMTEEEYMNKFGTSELMEYIEEDKDFHNQQCPTKEEENMDWR
jgi:ribosome silencing factor RsfS/YbeB/iojap